MQLPVVVIFCLSLRGTLHAGTAVEAVPSEHTEQVEQVEPTQVSEQTKQAEIAEQGCGGKPADVLFVLDSSASIGIKDFRKQITFTKDVVSLFDIADNNTRVGVALFSTDVYPMFSLTEYSDKLAVEKAIDNIPYKVGGTGTDKALHYIREKEFRKNSRPNVPKIAIVLTDGQSYDRNKTIQEAYLAHAEGISIFVIGIGFGVDEKELSALASSSEYLLKIGDYSALEKIKETLAIKACKVEYVKPTPLPIVSDQPVSSDQCTLRLIIGVDTNGVNSRNTKNVLAFISDLTDSLTSRPGKLRTSQLMTECAASYGRVRSKSYAPLIKKMRYQIARNSRTIKSAGLLFLNGAIDDLSQSRSEVNRALFAGFHLIVINIGGTVSHDVISQLLGVNRKSPEFSETVFEVSGYRKLPAVLNEITEAFTYAENCP